MYGDIIIQGATAFTDYNGIYEFHQILNDHASYKRIGMEQDYYVYKYLDGNIYIAPGFNISITIYYTSSNDILNAKWFVSMSFFTGIGMWDSAESSLKLTVRYKTYP